MKRLDVQISFSLWEGYMILPFHFGIAPQISTTLLKLEELIYVI